MKFKKHIFDVGAYNGLDGLALAVENKTILVHAFEANPKLINIIKNNKKKIEKYKKIKIKNYKLNNFAVSNVEKILSFNIAKNPTTSSLLKFNKNIDKTWPGYRQPHCTVIKVVKVRGITLAKYCKQNRINSIDYLHIDTQGNDLKVLKSLKKKINIVKKGILEAAIDKKRALYQNGHTIKEVKIFLAKKNFLISKIENVDKRIKNEKNIHFYKVNPTTNLNLNYKINYYNRIVNNKFNFFTKFAHELISAFI